MRKRRSAQKKRPRQNDKTSEPSVRGSEGEAASAVRHGSLAKRIIKGRRGRNKKVVVVRVFGPVGRRQDSIQIIFMTRSQCHEQKRGEEGKRERTRSSCQRRFPEKSLARCRKNDGKKRRIRREKGSVLKETSKRPFPGWVKLCAKLECFPFADGRRPFSHLIFTNPGKSIFEVPC